MQRLASATASDRGRGSSDLTAAEYIAYKPAAVNVNIHIHVKTVGGNGAVGTEGRSFGGSTTVSTDEARTS